MIGEELDRVGSPEGFLEEGLVVLGVLEEIRLVLPHVLGVIDRASRSNRSP